LIAKLDVKPGHRLLLKGAPNGFETELRPLPEGVALGGPGTRTADCILLFSTSSAHLETAFRQAVTLLPPAGVKVCAVTDIWSGLKFVRRLKDR
jgi:hypothetical protein